MRSLLKKKKKEKAKKPKAPKEAFAFLADSETTSSSNGEEVKQVRYQTQENCAKCQGAHPLYRCEAFFFLPPMARRQFILEKKLCLVCYRPNHTAKDCRFVNYKCRFGCKSRHNTDLHVSLEDYKKLRAERTANSKGPEGPNEELAHLVSSMDCPGDDDADQVCYMTGGAQGHLPSLSPSRTGSSHYHNVARSGQSSTGTEEKKRYTLWSIPVQVAPICLASSEGVWVCGEYSTLL